MNKTTTPRLMSLCFAFFFCFLMTSSTASAQTVDEVEKLLASWNVKEARQKIASMSQKQKESPHIVFLNARIAFYDGKYTKALELADQAINNIAVAPTMWEVDREMMKSAKEVTAKYKRHKSPKGYFEIAIAPGKDQVLLPYAFEALDKAYETLATILQHRPETPIRVEVYPNSLTLAKVSPLSDKDIRTTGTIALCKYNRLMLTSPNALLQGYGWVDTLVHEYVHYAINHKTTGRVPIWMHEGLAKYLERVWRSPNDHRLSPSSEHLLQKRFKANKLVTFEQMHPSMAMLPSAEDAAVAYAEVYTVIEHLHKTKGSAGIVSMLGFIDQGMDAKDAYAKALGVPFKKFEKEIWPGVLRARPVSQYPDPEKTGYKEELQFKDKKGKKKDEVAKISKPAARDHIHLGQMLQGRGRCKAAVVQYKKAIRLMGAGNPMVQTRLAQCLLEANKPKEALTSLETTLKIFPSYVTTWIELGRASTQLELWQKSRDYLLEAAYINPYNPEIHTLLAAVFEKLGDAERAKKERKLAALVQ